MQDMKRWTISYEMLLLPFGLLVTGIMLLIARFDPLQVLMILGLIYVLLRHVSKPLSRFIARLNYSVRWKFEVALLVVAMLFLIRQHLQLQGYGLHARGAARHPGPGTRGRSPMCSFLK